MEGGGRAASAGHGDHEEGAGRGASLHADQHGQPGLYLENARPNCQSCRFNGRMCASANPNLRC